MKTVAYDDLGILHRQHRAELLSAFERVLDSGRFVLGQHVQQFEQQFASYTGSTSCVGVASGLDALFLSVVASGLPPASEILVPSNTYIATILAVMHAGLTPVLVEPDIRTYNVDPTLLEQHITPRTRAVMITHMYGQPCDMEPIVSVCRRHGLHLIEDAAQAHGASYDGQMVGSFGDFGAFSFYPSKNLGALGDGGAITTNNPDLAACLRSLRNYGSAERYYNEHIGYNSRLDEVQAALLLTKLPRLHQINQHKQQLAKIYLDNLSKKYILPYILPDHAVEHVFHIFNIRIQPELIGLDRDSLRARLSDHGITTEVHYPVPPHRQRCFAGYFSGDYPISEEIHRTTLSLPISAIHTPQDIYYVVEVLNECAR